MMVPKRFNVLLSLSLLLQLLQPVSSLSTAGSNEAAKLAKSRLREALTSISGKLTLSPEVLIPEPSDPTAILLQSNAVKELSERLRGEKANVAFVSGSATAVQTFCNEQETARGNFPGPIPIVYCGKEGDNTERLAEAGVTGVLVTAKDGEEVKSVDELSADDGLKEACASVASCGMQAIPEVILSDTTVAEWTEETLEEAVKALTESIGEEPVGILFTVNAAPSSDDAGTSGQQEEFEHVTLPTVSDAASSEVPILGSVRVPAGGNRVSTEVSRMKEAGYTGVVLRSECVPGFRMNVDLEFIGRFWAACIADLKSTKSKAFKFQTRNYLESNLAIEWGKYQKSVIESGALGLSDEATEGLDADNGDYQGF